MAVDFVFDLGYLQTQFLSIFLQQNSGLNLFIDPLLILLLQPIKVLRIPTLHLLNPPPELLNLNLPLLHLNPLPPPLLLHLLNLPLIINFPLQHDLLMPLPILLQPPLFFLQTFLINLSPQNNLPNLLLRV